MRGAAEVLTAADYGFPSPASEDLSITTPGVDRAYIAGIISSDAWSGESAVADAQLLGSEPDVVTQQAVVTPRQELHMPLSFDALVGADVDPAPKDALSLPSDIAGPALRLPSFTRLGINITANANANANQAMPDQHPAPDHMLARDDLSHFPPQQTSEPGTGASYDPFSGDDLIEQVVALQQKLDSPGVSSFMSPLPSPAFQHFVTTLTPPDENGHITWEAITKVATGPMNSSSTESANEPTGFDISRPAIPATPDTAVADPYSISLPTITTSPPLPADLGGPSSSSRPAWLEPVIKAILDNVNMPHRTEPMKVLSHALPTPSVEGHVFPAIIRSLQDQTPASSMCWINVFHALPGKFNLADLPRSPPSTPGPPVTGDDYFTSKTFDSAVSVCDYNANLSTIPQSPSPIVPPSSVDVSVVERYIPPTSANEFSEMFNVSGHSILVDRLVELSPDNGTLIFIYPTKKGGRTFTNKYLGPVLEPILRSIVVVNGFSADMGSSAGTMAAAPLLPDHDIMRLRINNLCATLSQSSPRMEKFHRQQATFSLVYAAKEEVKLDRTVWADAWWCKQEKPRLRETINRYFRRANGASDDTTPPMIIHELLESVSTNPYRNGDPDAGIEVSVFVVKRSG